MSPLGSPSSNASPALASPLSPSLPLSLALDFFLDFFRFFLLGSGPLFRVTMSRMDREPINFRGVYANDNDVLGRRPVTKRVLSCAASRINIQYWHCTPRPSDPTTCPLLSPPRRPFVCLATARVSPSSVFSPHSPASATLTSTYVRGGVRLSNKRLRSHSAPFHGFLTHSILPGHVSPRTRSMWL